MRHHHHRYSTTQKSGKWNPVDLMCCWPLLVSVCVARSYVCVFFFHIFTHSNTIRRPHRPRRCRRRCRCRRRRRRGYVYCNIYSQRTDLQQRVCRIRGRCSPSLFPRSEKNETKRNNIMYIPPVHDAHNIKSHTHTRYGQQLYSVQLLATVRYYKCTIIILLAFDQLNVLLIEFLILDQHRRVVLNILTI